MKENIKSEYLIIGAGLTGLTLAFYLKKAGKNIVLAEKNKRTGGVIKTIKEEGFSIEAGPNTGILSTPEIVELFDELGKDVSLEKPGKTSKVRWIWKDGKWHALPSGLKAAVGTPLFSTKDKFRILGEPFRKPGKNKDETVADLVRRRMGKSYLNYAVDPFISGIYAGDPELLVTRHALPKLYRLEQEYGSFIRGAIKKKAAKKDPRETKATREVFSARGGLQNLTDAMTKRIGRESILTSCKEISINKSKGSFTCFIQKENGERTDIYARHIIITSGPNALNTVLPFVNQKEISTIQNLRYAPVVQVAAGYKHWEGIELDAFGGLIPSRENKQALGVLFPSSIFSHRAPKGGALLSAFFGGMKKTAFINKNDEEIREVAMMEIRETLQTGQKPDLLKIFRYPYAIPQYEKSTEERLQAIEKIQDNHPGLILAGNIRDGIGMADRVKQARKIADKLIN